MDMISAGARRRFAGFGVVAAAVAVVAAGPADARDRARDRDWPNQVNARYRLTFNGFQVGASHDHRDLVPDMGQARGDHAADGAGADDADLHGSFT